MPYTVSTDPGIVSAYTEALERLKCDIEKVISRTPVDEQVRSDLITKDSLLGQSLAASEQVGSIGGAPIPPTDSYGNQGQDNTAVSVNLPAQPGVRYVVKHIVFGYSERPPQPRQLILQSGGQVKWSTWIAEAGAGPVTLEIILPENTDLQFFFPASGQNGILGDAWIEVVEEVTA